MSKATVVKLLATDIAGHWTAIKWVLRNFAEASNEDARGFLMSMLCGAITCWRISEDKKLKAFVFTSITTYPPYDRKCVNVHTMYAFSIVTDQTWLEVARVLNDFAKANNCTHLTGYSSNARVIRLLERVGATGTMNFVKEVT